MSEKIDVEIVRDFDGRYYANMWRDGIRVEGLPEYVTYRELRRAIERKTGFRILPLSALKMRRFGRKDYGYFNNYEEHDGIWDLRKREHWPSVQDTRSTVTPVLSPQNIASKNEITKPMQEEWTDYCDEHVMLLRPFPAFSGLAFECLKVVCHPDEDGTVSVLHEMIFIDDYTQCNCRGAAELNNILAGFGYADLDDYVRDQNGDDDWVYREDNSVNRDVSPSWYINFSDLASLICESHDHGIKMTPEDANHAVHRITGKDYSLDWFTELARATTGNTPSFDHRLHNAATRNHAPSSAETVLSPHREIER